MVCDNTKRVVVIRNIPSNFIEEAILVLKNKPERGVGKNIKKVFSKNDNKISDHILKEAEEVINNYIRRNGAQKELGPELHLRPSHNKPKLLTSTVINLALIGSIVLLLFLVVKLL
ncbi:hypothetical protein [Acetivibrio clariflavus]|jgi:hypothetical protein|uniref:Uncharacterized protein n=1 Tax=Acetivibrio clariflavus (strain DSM 19732 / NBRC 101661 / EBR45) TaxID=720554 RepID=G8LY08_ACECE|nr:hypothetical protein [Acetivibrio clariflavus]AEV69940.1 hypothetical protein Clocl_3446 [Acetivibrio clariflavus DSM 19732]NLM59017.1 hypothetical protein [Clostridium sp.]HQA56411.1 hypothetical protein [Acetivibrio sp.]